MAVMADALVKTGFADEGCVEIIAICTITDAFVLAVVSLPVQSIILYTAWRLCRG